MTDLIQSSINSSLVKSKLEDAIINLSSRLKDKTNSSIALSSGEIYNTITEYFKELAEAKFIPDPLLENDSPRSEQYNKTLLAIHSDIKRFYEELSNLTDIQIQSYNYSSIISQDILAKANSLGSIVLDLNILSNFNRGDSIVAGDDFNNLDYLDFDIGLSSEPGELLPGGGISLARDSVLDVVDETTSIEVVPIAPTDGQSSVRTSPTAGNFNRFYEGNYYNFLGLARPEGGYFNIKFMLEPEDIKQDRKAGLKAQTKKVESEPQPANSLAAGVAGPTTTTTVNRTSKDTNLGDLGLLVDLGASPEAKKLARLRMFDKDPSTFWECEFLYKLPQPLLSDISDNAVLEEGGDSGAQGASLTIDLREAERLAQAYDIIGQDLIVDLIITLQETKSINFIVLNPVVFGSDSFPEIMDIATTTENEGEFKTIDGWDSIKFAKYITSEANEFLTDSQTGAVLAPTKATFKGQGIFPFPVREAKKIKIRIKVDNPVPSPYERVYALMKNDTKVTTTITTKTTKGALRF